MTRTTHDYEAEFRAGSIPPSLEGPFAGTLLRTTMNRPADAITRAVTPVWMPWRGKVFDPVTASGRNIFTPGFRPLMRLLWNRYDDVRPFDADHFTTFPFRTWTGPSAFTPGVEVLKIDYDLPESPAFIVRPILDELVRVGDGRYLGQALMRWSDGVARAAWFQLEAKPPR